LHVAATTSTLRITLVPVAEPAWQPEPSDELISELERFAADEADGLATLAAELRLIGEVEPSPVFDLEAIWYSVERHIDLGPPPADDGGSENG
jgi:hypothetical protein